MQFIGKMLTKAKHQWYYLLDPEHPEWFTVYLGGNIIIISEALFLDLGSKIHRKTVFFVSPKMTAVITRRQKIPVLESTIS